MSNDRLDETDGLLGHVINHVSDSLRKRREQKAHNFANSEAGIARQSANALTRWEKKIKKDWVGYQAIHDTAPTIDNLARFAQLEYGITLPSRASAASATPAPAPSASQAASQSAAPATPAPAAPVAGTAPAAAAAPAPTGQTGTFRTVVKQKASPAPATSPAPASTPAAPAPTAVPQAPAATAKDRANAKLHSDLTKWNEVIKDPNSTPEQVRAAREAQSKALKASSIGANNGRVQNEGAIGEDKIGDKKIKSFDELPARIDNRDFKDRSFIDTAKDLGLFDKPDEKEEKAGRQDLTETEAALNAEQFSAWAKTVARTILHDKPVAIASRKFDPDSPEYGKFLAQLRTRFGSTEPQSISANNGRVASNTSSVPNSNAATPKATKGIANFFVPDAGKKLLDNLQGEGVDLNGVKRAIAAASANPNDLDKQIANVSVENLRKVYAAFLKTCLA